MSEENHDDVLPDLMKARAMDRVTAVTPPISASPHLAFVEAGENGHEHTFELICRGDRYGTSVFECNCGARKRMAKGVSGLVPVTLDVQPHYMGDCLFEKTHMISQRDYDMALAQAAAQEAIGRRISYQNIVSR